MQKVDYSLEIFDKYYGGDDRLVKIVLKDGQELEGIFVGVFHGDTDRGEPFILKWHFVEKDEIAGYQNFVPTEESEVAGEIIRQADIASVSFCDELKK